jgi:hypothetical protein
MKSARPEREEGEKGKGVFHGKKGFKHAQKGEPVNLARALRELRQRRKGRE